MGGSDKTVLVDSVQSNRTSLWSIAIAAFVFLTTFVCAVAFSVYILNRIDAVEKEVVFYDLQDVIRTAVF